MNQLHLVTGEPLWVNPRHVSHVTASDSGDGAVVWIAGWTTGYILSESVDQVIVALGVHEPASF